MLAPAKINLALHVTGQRADGYHLLDSAVVFANIGDALSLIPNGFAVDGPFAAALKNVAEEDNLIWRAAQAFATKNGTPAKAIGYHLTKNLPVASGIGGGSADCAAALSLMNGWFNGPFNKEQLAEIGLQLGADVPVCLRGAPSRMEGVGEALSPLPPLPAMGVVLVNPGVAVSTQQVFAGLANKNNPTLGLPQEWSDYPAFIEWLANQRNDLQAPAIKIAPAIGEALAALEEADIARMSGSGATVFGLCESKEMAQQVAAKISAEYPDWWVVATTFRA